MWCGALCVGPETPSNLIIKVEVVTDVFIELLIIVKIYYCAIKALVAIYVNSVLFNFLLLLLYFSLKVQFKEHWATWLIKKMCRIQVTRKKKTQTAVKGITTKSMQIYLFILKFRYNMYNVLGLAWWFSDFLDLCLKCLNKSLRSYLLMLRKATIYWNLCCIVTARRYKNP